jgi:Lon protease-like protein
MATKGQELPIFELPVVLLPGELLPLHIFEERYKRMISRCIEVDEPFGIVLRDEDGSAHRVGCEARVSEVLERFEDGRMNVLVEGERPFKVLDRYDASEFPAGEVEPIEADRSPGEDAEGEGARAAFAALVRRVSGEPPDAEELAAVDSFELASRVELPPPTKQRLLELRSERQRMGVLDRAFRNLLETIERSEEIAERARMNGKVIVARAAGDG